MLRISKHSDVSAVVADDGAQGTLKGMSCTQKRQGPIMIKDSC
jgi:hypothetical protein